MWPKNNKLISWGLCLLLVLLLASVRLLEMQLFYDPFVTYFKNDYQTQPYPSFDSIGLLFSYAFRFGLNSLLSLMLLFVLFADKGLIKLAACIYGLFFIVLMLSFLALFWVVDQPATFLVFYLRRFIIQPLLVLLFIPAFYYQKHQ